MCLISELQKTWSKKWQNWSHPLCLLQNLETFVWSLFPQTFLSLFFWGLVTIILVVFNRYWGSIFISKFSSPLKLDYFYWSANFTAFFILLSASSEILKILYFPFYNFCSLLFLNFWDSSFLSFIVSIFFVLLLSIFISCSKIFVC